MNSNKVSVSQNKQASAIHYFKLAVDTLFLRMENNLADPKEDFHFNNEEHIIEKAEQIDILYENLFISDEKKSELRQYILKEADVFNSKYREVYGDVYMDNYLNFVDCRDYDVFEAEKKENANQYKVKKPIINVIVTDSDSESESDDESDDEENPPMCSRCNSLILDNVGFHYDEKTDVYIHGDCKDDDSESESESESEDEKEVFIRYERVIELKKELKNMKEKNKEFFIKIVEAEKENVSKDDKINELEDKNNTLGLKIKALEYQLTEKHQQWQYEGMKEKLKHFTDLNSERWDELQKMKETADKRLKRLNELDDIIWTQKNKIDELKKENEKLKNDDSNDDLTIENKDHFNNDMHCCLACAINVKIADLKRIQKEYTSKVKKGLYC